METQAANTQIFGSSPTNVDHNNLIDDRHSRWHHPSKYSTISTHTDKKNLKYQYWHHYNGSVTKHAPIIDTCSPRSLLVITLTLFSVTQSVIPTSINYGAAPQPITDINQLMPKMCQNQTSICEGSFCIPGLRKCVCDLRTPVQFGKYCLRQLDIGTQCFVTSQCNHTIKSSVCIDQSTGHVIDDPMARFKLDQWHQLNELRIKSNQATAPQVVTATGSSPNTTDEIETTSSQPIDIITTNVPVGNMRNSPYEIGYPSEPYNDTSNADDRIDSLGRVISRPSARSSSIQSIQTIDTGSSTTISTTEIVTSTQSSTTQSAADLNSSVQKSYTTISSVTASTERPPDTTTNSVIIPTMSQPNQRQPTQDYVQSIPTLTGPSHVNSNSNGVQRKSRTKWPPGKCACPSGFMFDHMLRKCVTISIHDTYCKSDNDCVQIPITHCFMPRSKCECDELYIWDQTRVACVRETQAVEERPPQDIVAPDMEYQLPKFLFLDETTSVVVVGCCIVIGVLLLLISTVRCFTSKPSSAPSTPRSRSKSKGTSNNQQGTLRKGARPPASPVSLQTMSRPVSQLSNSNKETRGRILNYDFEQNTIYSHTPTNSKKSDSPSRL